LLPTTGDTPDPTSHMMDKDVYFTPLRNTESAAGFYATLFNSFELSGPDDPFAPFVPTMKSAAGVLFDHRAGEGGLQYLAQELTTPFLPPAKRVTQIAPQAYVWNDQFDAATGKTLFDWAEDEASGRNSGAADFDPARRAALLIVNGGSTGDFFPFLMKGPKNVRVFGSSTRGGFSTAQYFTFGSMSWGFGAGDSLRPDGTTLLGTGVDPDEVVLPRQSDVLRGIDTALARAREWLTTCTDCTGDMP
jgi:C-terminal processing protease CtpA/Prc